MADGSLLRRGVVTQVGSGLLRLRLLGELEFKPDACPVLERLGSPPSRQPAHQGQPPPVEVERGGPANADRTARTVVANRDLQPPRLAVQADHELGGAGGVAKE